MILNNISILTLVLLISASKVLMNTETPDNDSDDEKFIDGIDHLKSGKFVKICIEQSVTKI